MPEVTVGGYQVAWSLLDLDSWVQASSTRICIFAVSADIGGQSVVALAQELAQAMQRDRAKSSPEAWQSAILRPGSDAGLHRLTSESEVAVRGARENAEHKWRQQEHDLRKRWARAGKPHWDTCPWTSPASSAFAAP